jgi:hexosaminidase
MAILFLPNPQKVTFLEGCLEIKPGLLILVEGPPCPNMVFIAQQAQKALKIRSQVHWQITSSWAVPRREVGLYLEVVPAEVVHAQGYILKISSSEIVVKGHDLAGVFYGINTFIQLLVQVKDNPLPCLAIEDWPDFPARGVMLDVSRDKVPQMKTLYELVDQLASWKINQIQLYTEHTFAYRNHPEVWKLASPLTGEEIIALDAYCRERFIELVPNQNSFGHMARWLKIPLYAHLAEIHGEIESPWGNVQGPFSLAPANPGSLKLVRGLYDELLPHFSSRMVNVGCDETIDLGKGQSKLICEERGLYRVYLDFLLDIYKDVSRRGLKMQFWGDIIVQAPELIPEIPPDVIGLIWGYEADHPFDEEGRHFKSAGVPFYVCPGTSSWNTIAGRTENCIRNLLNAAENGLKHGASGYLNTDWGDNGHWQTLPVSYLGFAAGAAYSWALETNRALEIPAVLDTLVFEDDAGVMGQLVYDLGNVYKAAGLEIQNASPLFGVLQRSLEEIASYPGVRPELFQISLQAVEKAAARQGEETMACQHAALIRREYALVVRMLRHACQRGLLALESDERRGTALKEVLRKDLRELMDEYQLIWLERNRPGGLSDSLAHFHQYLQ